VLALRAEKEQAMTTVTVVDDEPSALDVLVRAARSWSFDCQAARSAEQALQLLEQNPTPIVVTDLRMPGKGGVWLVGEIRRLWPEIAVIVITAGDEADSVAQCLDAGAHQFFLKPINLDEFRHALEATWRHYRLQRQHALHRLHLEQTVQRQTKKIRRTYLSAIDSLVRTLEARDPSTSGHSLRVRAYALRLADVIGLENGLRKKLALAAKLHDIGKVGLPEAILNKPNVLNEEESGVVREHPVVGERILKPFLRCRLILSAIRGHHERYDGTGYPDGLRGEQIPLLARLVTLADCYDALTSSRAYRDPLLPAEALEIIRQGAGRQFDPLFVPAFLEAVEGIPNVRPAVR
jgi:putative two-component system response regulator